MRTITGCYPTRTNSVPYSDQPPGATPDNTQGGNFYNIDGLANGYNDGYAVTGSPSYSSTQNYLTDVGAYTSSSVSTARSIRGAMFGSGMSRSLTPGRFGACGAVRSAPTRTACSPPFWNSYYPGSGASVFGFRVATVPEPSTAVLAALGLIGFAAWGWRRKR